ncbi:MAG: hypothetical protein I3274_05650 [Candidatus Moeniiplasma glomeromycotorum]|nr:hypothetical protein [Candidatus Moeniiplasma glomeromycotorum]
MNSYNTNINQQKLNKLNSADEIKLAQEKIKKIREKELEKEIFNISPILRNSPRPVEVYEERGNSARKSLFFFPSLFTEKLNKKFVYLTKQVLLCIDPDPESGFFDRKGKEFRERTSKNEKVRERIENIFVKEFVQVLERIFLIKELCWKKDYRPDSTKDFKELKIDEPQLFFENLFKYIDEKFDNPKDILIITDQKTYRFIKQNEKGKFLESYIGNLLESDLENNIKLIIVSQKGLLIPYSVELITDNNYREKEENYHYLNISYEIDLMDNNPIAIFKEENADNSSISQTN